MASGQASVVGQLNDEEYLNWLKAATVLHCTTVVLQKFCEREMIIFHRSLSTAAHGNIRCLGPCTTANLVYTGRNGIHNWSIACPNNVCSKYLTGVLAARTRTQLRLHFENSNIGQWPTEAWQVAKLYMAFGQDPASTSSADTDAAGLLQLMTNCTHFNAALRSKADDVSLQYSTMFS